MTRVNLSKILVILGSIVILSLVLTRIWFSYVLDPWKAVLHSDDGVPYLMSIMPWIKQDFYYWGEARFGSVYVSMWKLLGRPLFGYGAYEFYFGHLFLFFVGLGLWLASLPRWLDRFVFFWIFVPINFPMIDLYGKPGHLYGMLFLISGLSIFTIFHFQDTIFRRCLLGLLAGVSYWQHELSGVFQLGFAMAASLPADFMRPSISIKVKFWKKNFRTIAPMFTGFLIVFIFAEVARSWSKKWAHVDHFSWEKFPQFLNNMQDFFSHGFRLYQNIGFGFAILGLFIFIVHSAIFHVGDDAVIGKLIRYSAVAITCCLLIINDNTWYLLNGRADRYFAFLINFILFLALSAFQAKKWSSGNLKRLVIILFLSASAFAHQPATEMFMRASQIDARMSKDRSRIDFVQSLKKAGCRYYLGKYWETFVLAPYTETDLTPISYETPRQKDLFAEIIAAGSFCADVDFKAKALLLPNEFCTNIESFISCNKSVVAK